MALRSAAYTLILFAAWNFNLLGLPDAVHWSRREPRSGYLGSESHLVLYRLLRADVHPLTRCSASRPTAPDLTGRSSGRKVSH